MKLIPTRFQVLNYRNIDDSGWIPLERVTAFVGRNEAGKTALLKALHKFNPAAEEPYSAQREFPRDRFTADYRDGGDWPVCRVEFQLSSDFREEIGERLHGSAIPQKAVSMGIENGTLSGIENGTLREGARGGSVATGAGAFPESRRLTIRPPPGLSRRPPPWTRSGG